MFDLSSSKLLVLAIIALIVVGPKDLPVLLRTVGRYLGMLRRQASEFRTQFEDAMRESELADLKKEVEKLGEETKSTLAEAGRSFETQVGDLNRELNTTISDVDKAMLPPPVQVAEAATSHGDAGSQADAAAAPGMTTAGDAASTPAPNVLASAIPAPELPDPGAIEPPIEFRPQAPVAAPVPAAAVPVAPVPAQPRETADAGAGAPVSRSGA